MLKDGAGVGDGVGVGLGDGVEGGDRFGGAVGVGVGLGVGAGVGLAAAPETGVPETEVLLAAPPHATSPGNSRQHSNRSTMPSRTRTKCETISIRYFDAKTTS